MKALLCLFTSLLLCQSFSYGQNRQVRYDGLGTPYYIFDSKMDSQGNIVSIGAANYPFIMKTDKSGNKIWSKTVNCPYISNLTPLKVQVDASGNYLVLLKYQIPVLIKFSPEGELLSSIALEYSNQVNENTTSFTLLPNGNIAVCGFNDFDYNMNSQGPHWMGYIYIVDSTGVPVALKSFTFTGNGSTQCYFYDITCSANKIYICGANGGYPLILSTDLNGDNHVESIFPALDTINNVYYSNLNYNKICYKDGTLYVGGTIADYYYTHGMQIVGTLDTSTFSFHGALITSLIDTNTTDAFFYARDSSTVFFANQDVASHGKSVFYGKIVSDTLVQTQKMISDSVMSLSSFTMANDIALFTGNIAFNGSHDAFLASYSTAVPSAQLANVVDTQVYFSIFDQSPSTPLAPTVEDRPTDVPSVTQITDTPCIIEMNICGVDTSCKPYSFVQPVASSVVCFGDTVFLSVEGCFHSGWYCNDTLLTAGVGEVLAATHTGAYYFVADNNVCYDTSSAAQVTVRAPFIPVITRSGDTLKATHGIAYQWLNSDSTPIANATDSFWVYTTPGEYAVSVIDSFGCPGVSVLFNTGNASVGQFSADDDDIHIYPNPATNKFTIAQKNEARLEVEINDGAGRIISYFIQTQPVATYNTSSMHIPPGLYFIKIRNDVSITIYKLVIMD